MEISNSRFWTREKVRLIKIMPILIMILLPRMISQAFDAKKKPEANNNGAWSLCSCPQFVMRYREKERDHHFVRVTTFIFSREKSLNRWCRVSLRSRCCKVPGSKLEKIESHLALRVFSNGLIYFQASCLLVWKCVSSIFHMLVSYMLNLIDN